MCYATEPILFQDIIGKLLYLRPLLAARKRRKGQMPRLVKELQVLVAAND